MSTETRGSVLDLFPHLLVNLVQRLRHDMRIRQHGHEIRVSVPAGNDVQMDVVEHASASGAAEIEADIETIGLEGFRQKLFAAAGQHHDVKQFLLRKIVEFGGVFIRCDHQMPGGVGKRVQQCKAIPLPDNDVVLRVVGLL